MDKNLFQQAREAFTNFTSTNRNQQGQSEQEKEIVRRAIEAARVEATPEEKEQLKQFEQQLDGKLH